jgi:NADP-dependent 3-hydroxy acid dehydrogenase YdfG
MERIWLITGASSGFGSALAETALRAGHTVIATARNPVEARQSHPQIESLGGHWMQLDVSSPDAQEKVRESIGIHGRIDVLVNAAGYSILGSIEDAKYVHYAPPNMDDNNTYCTVRMRYTNNSTLMSTGLFES